MDKVRILAVAPYQGLKEMIAQVAAKREDVAVTTCLGDLSAGLEAARQALESGGYDIILSRGGTADLLSREVDLPILDIPISLGDILQAIKLAQNYQAKFAILGFPSITERAHLICSLLDYAIEVHTVRDAASVPDLVQRLKAEGCMLLIGDTVTTTVARRHGLNAILITSNTESIATALDQAVKLSASYFKLRQRSRMVQAVVDNAPCSTLMYDRQGRLLFSALNIKEDEHRAALLRRVESELNALLESPGGRQEWVAGQTCLSIDACWGQAGDQKALILYLWAKAAPPAFTEGGVTVLNRSDTLHQRFNRYYGFSGAMADTNRAIERFGRQQVPIVLAGEQGTGKDSVAAYLYSIGPYKDNPLYTVDCCLVSDKQLMWLLKRPDSPLNDMHVTLYFKNMLLLSPLRREQLLEFLEHLAGQKHCRIICSFVTHEGERAGDEAAWLGISARLNAVLLRLPPLRARKDDIPSIATLYLSQLNDSLGKQLTGFTPEALELLTNFEWPYNLDQFHRVLRELASVTPAFYISKEDTTAILRSERARYAPGSAANINLNQPLSDITYDVVRLVLEQEGNNQKKAAERLGIGRSTVWRILKSREG